MPDNGGLIIKWNNDMMYFITGSIKSSFFADSANSARYGIKEIRYQNNYDDQITDSTMVTIDDMGLIMDSTAVVTDVVDIVIAPPPPVL